jgi:hypothetical protein
MERDALEYASRVHPAIRLSATAAVMITWTRGVSAALGVSAFCVLLASLSCASFSLIQRKKRFSPVAIASLVVKETVLFAHSVFR